MIVTKELLLASGWNSHVIDTYIKDAYLGLLRQVCVDAIQADVNSGTQPDWLPSLTNSLLRSGPAIFANGQYILNEKFTISGLGIDNPETIYTAKQDALNAIAAQQEAYFQSENFIFHVQARYKVGEDGWWSIDVTGSVNPDPGHPVDHYATFNMYTGLYEQFSDYPSAQARCDQLQQERQAEVALGYQMQQEIQEINNPEDNAVGLYPVTLA